MTKSGVQNRFGQFIFEDEQAERVAAGDMSAVWEFLEDNRIFLTRWARKFIRNRFFFLPAGYIEAEEMFNQIYVDFSLYKLENEKTVALGIWRSFFGITSGGFQFSRKIRQNKEISFDASVNVSHRSGEKEDGETLGNLLPSGEPSPYDVLEREEEIREAAPNYFATIGEILGYRKDVEGKQANAFRDTIEVIFAGLTFEEVERYATKIA